MIPAVKIENIAEEKAELTVLKTLCYFDIFNYPLTLKEIKNFLGYYVASEELSTAIQVLVTERLIFQFDEFFSLQNDKRVVDARLKGNARAEKLLPRALKIGQFLFQFPFVKAVGISGSLSKHYADARADIDFFIITQENRLWIARTLLHIFKKFTFLIGRQHFYCMNYFVDEKAILISEQNIYSATEVVTLLPTAGRDTLRQFYRLNQWTEEFLPAYRENQQFSAPSKNGLVKRALEKVFAKGFGDRVDRFLFKWTSKRWQKKERSGRLNTKGNLMTLVTDRHFSKSDPGAFQEKVIAAHEEKIEQLRVRCPRFFVKRFS